MYTLIKKEISGFFNSLAGYIVIIVFTTTTGLFLWLIPNETNIINNGYADMTSFFNIAPQMFLFLIPAICMRLFSEEKKNKTLELLLSRPIPTLKIVFSKYLSALIIVAIAIIPSILYYYSIYQLASPIGNIDTGAIIGSYIGLIFLSSIFVSVSLYASSLSENQIISFILATTLCFIFFSGIEYISTIPILSNFENSILYLAISTHYEPMTKGIIDTRDFLWFLCITLIFIHITKRKIQILKR